MEEIHDLLEGVTLSSLILNYQLPIDLLFPFLGCTFMTVQPLEGTEFCNIRIKRIPSGAQHD